MHHKTKFNTDYQSEATITLTNGRQWLTNDWPIIDRRQPTKLRPVVVLLPSREPPTRIMLSEARAVDSRQNPRGGSKPEVFFMSGYRVFDVV